MKASANGTLPAKTRQIMYRARGRIQDRTDKPLNDQYFTQTLLPNFDNEYPELTRNWNIVWDARGHLIEPHTRRNVPLGTLEVRKYLGSVREPQWSDPVAVVPQLGTRGPSSRCNPVKFESATGYRKVPQTFSHTP